MMRWACCSVKACVLFPAGTPMSTTLCANSLECIVKRHSPTMKSSPPYQLSRAGVCVILPNSMSSLQSGNTLHGHDAEGVQKLSWNPRRPKAPQLHHVVW